ncbi:MAG: hypothetical protein OHK0029_35870 [Armatimonadaceae bacterium]
MQTLFARALFRRSDARERTAVPNPVKSAIWLARGAFVALSFALLSALPVQAQTLNLTGSQTYTANDNTYQFGTINAYDSSTLNIVTGGNVFQTFGYDTSTLNISGGSVGFTNGNDTSTVNISGGSVGTADSRDTSTVNISGGDVRSAYGYNTSTVNISGGYVDLAYGSNTSVFNISGGTFFNRFLGFFDDSVLNLFGTGLTFSSAGAGSDDFGSFTAYTLNGRLANGDFLSDVTFYDYDGGASVGDPNAGTGNLRFVNSAAAPEPAFCQQCCRAGTGDVCASGACWCADDGRACAFPHESRAPEVGYVVRRVSCHTPSYQMGN